MDLAGPRGPVSSMDPKGPKGPKGSRRTKVLYIRLARLPLDRSLVLNLIDSFNHTALITYFGLLLRDTPTSITPTARKPHARFTDRYM
jgi:hypothetical protein